MGGEQAFRAALVAIVVIVLCISIYHRRRARRRTRQIPRRAEDRSLILLRLFVGLPAWLAVLAYAIQPRWMAWSQVALPAWVRWSAALVACTMIPLSFWIFRSLGENVSETVLTKDDQTLVTWGPYRWVRHPLYAAGTLWAVALSLLMASWFLGLMTAGFVLLLPSLVRREEAELVTRFGVAYTEYMGRTGRLLPRLGRRP